MCVYEIWSAFWVWIGSMTLWWMHISHCWLSGQSNQASKVHIAFHPSFTPDCYLVVTLPYPGGFAMFPYKTLLTFSFHYTSKTIGHWFLWTPVFARFSTWIRFFPALLIKLNWLFLKGQNFCVTQVSNRLKSALVGILIYLIYWYIDISDYIDAIMFIG